MDSEQTNDYIEGLRYRAMLMWVEGNPPTPKWWLERIEELLKKVAPHNTN